MPDQNIHDDPLDARRRRARFRAWHRGTREADLVVGRFADAHLAGMDAQELRLFEALLDEVDADIVPWVTGARPVPPERDDAVLRRLIDHARSTSI